MECSYDTKPKPEDFSMVLSMVFSAPLSAFSFSAFSLLVPFFIQRLSALSASFRGRGRSKNVFSRPENALPKLSVQKMDFSSKNRVFPQKIAFFPQKTSCFPCGNSRFRVRKRTKIFILRIFAFSAFFLLLPKCA